jgi:hypothetical protein
MSLVFVLFSLFLLFIHLQIQKCQNELKCRSEVVLQWTFLFLFWNFLCSFFEAIYTVSDQDSMVKKYGSWFDYNLAPRAQIFKRDQSKVVDLDSMMKLMRYMFFLALWNRGWTCHCGSIPVLVYTNTFPSIKREKSDSRFSCFLQ